MINLIPSTAKKGILTEYWVRVFSVWCFVWSIALIAGVAILVPAYVLIHSQVNVYTESAQQASQKIVDFENVSEALVQSSQQAATLVDGGKEPLFSNYIMLFKELQYPGIKISSINISRSEKGTAPVQIMGEATDRQALAAFRDRLLEQPQVTAVDLPISNLARNKDIQFTITVTINNEIAL